MPKRLFLLDGMALVYRAHFAFISRPIVTSKGFNTSALFGYANTLIELIQNQKPTHLAVAFDSEEPTQRHQDFPEYKAQRQEMPEDLGHALPHVRRLTEAFNISALITPGYEADDLIGTLSRQAEQHRFETYMVTPDKDFAQLVSPKTFIYKPSRMGDGVEILGVPEILKKWGITQVSQVIDILGLWGDAADNIPGVPGIGEKTAQKLIAQYGSIDNLLDHVHDLKGKLKETLQSYREQALLSKKLVTIDCNAPIEVSLNDLKWDHYDEQALKSLFVEFEFNALGRRLFGDDFKAGRGYGTPGPKPVPVQSDLLLESAEDETQPVSQTDPSAPQSAPLKTLKDVEHAYHPVTTAAARRELITHLQKQTAFCFDIETTDLDPKGAELVGLAFSCEPHTGYFVPLNEDRRNSTRILEEFRPLLESDNIEKVGHNLKFDIGVLLWHGVRVQGPMFDTMIAHSLIEPEMRHGMDYLSEVYLGYSPVPITRLIGERNTSQISMREVELDQISEYAAEDADVTWQLHTLLKPLLKEKGQEKVFYEIESPLIPVLAAMEVEGIRLDPAALEKASAKLASDIAEYETKIHELAGRPFNINSPKQLGEILFDVLKLGTQPKKTRTGQYATNEQTLQTLASKHPIVQLILDHRAASKLKSTYVDMLPNALFEKTGRIHTSFGQVMTATGRLQSQDPNLQNIPIRTDQGREIRKAFVAKNQHYQLLSADYSQIELRIIAALSHDPAMTQAFADNLDIHAATAAKIYNLDLESVNDEMRRMAKTVNFGLIYGMSAFGLAQRLGIPRADANTLIEQYFRQFPGVRQYMDQSIEFARRHGFVQTVTGRRRYLRDINSANATIRGAAERNAINAPIQGTAADMIKLAMISIHKALQENQLQTRMLLQIHDELLFDMPKSEKDTVLPLVEEHMKKALPLQSVPIVVELGVGRTWLEAH